MEETICDEEQVKGAYNEHFQTIFRRDKVPAEHGIQKPWLNSNKARHFQHEAEQNRMTWPPKIDEALVKAVLSRGTQTPSPGPDECEKWCLRNLPEEGIEILTKLVRYTVENNHFPGIMKETILVPIYKKGDPTILGNYRGIMLTNNILNIALTIEERCLQKWCFVSILDKHQTI